MKIFKTPTREYIIIFLAILGLALYVVFKDEKFLFLASLLGSVAIFTRAIISIWKRQIGIDVFNTFALGVSFATNEIRSAAFIVLMLAFADILEHYNESRSRKAVEELLKLKPLTAARERDGKDEEISIEAIKENDIIIVPTGSRIPVDGIIIYGKAYIDESSVTGESMPVEKIIGDKVLTSTLNESGVLKVRAVGIGKDSTIERMASLIREALKNKSRSERLADKFARIFLPIVLLLGAGTYFFTHNIIMTASIFLVACADDMSVAIPLAVTAALGKAAKRGVVIKGGAWIDQLSRVKTLVLDKTGTLTYGKLSVEDSYINPEFEENNFWSLVGSAEKYSEHPAGRADVPRFAGVFGNFPDRARIRGTLRQRLGMRAQRLLQTPGFAQKRALEHQGVKMSRLFMEYPVKPLDGPVRLAVRRQSARLYEGGLQPRGATTEEEV